MLLKRENQVWFGILDYSYHALREENIRSIEVYDLFFHFPSCVYIAIPYRGRQAIKNMGAIEGRL